MFNSTVPSCVETTTLGLYVISLGVVFSCCVFVLSVLILVTLARTPALHNNTNCYIASNSVADILGALTMAMRAIVQFANLIENEHNIKPINIALLAMTYAPPLSSAIHLAVIAIDRYIYILKPFYYMKHMTRTRIIKLLLLVWTLPVIYLVTPGIFYRSDKFNSRCILQQPPVEYYVVAMAILGIVCVIICVCYFRIAIVAFNRKKGKIARRQAAPNEVNCASTHGNAAMKSVRFFVAMCGTYFVSYIPLAIFLIITAFGYRMSTYTFVTNTFCFNLHTLANFCIYFAVNKDFRLGVKKQFVDCLRMCCQQK